MSDEIVKTCTRCQQTYPLTAYYPHKRGLHGRDSICRECSRAKSRAAYYKPKDTSRPRTTTTTAAPMPEPVTPPPGQVHAAIVALTSSLAPDHDGDLVWAAQVAMLEAAARGLDQALTTANPQGQRQSIVSLRELLTDVAPPQAAPTPHDPIDELIASFGAPVFRDT